MKKQAIVYLLTFITLMTGCGLENNSDSLNDSENSTETIVENTENTENTDTESIISNKTNDKITIDDEKETPSYYAKNDDSVEILKISAVYPVITIDGNTTASKKINDSIKSEMDTFRNFEKENAKEAEELYQMSLDSMTEFFPYSAEFSYTLKRCDNRVISIVFHQNDYTGGAHGNYWSYGVTFDAKTGERLYLESLTTDYAAFYQMLLDKLAAQADLPAYQNYLYDGQTVDVDHTLLNDSASWYFDRSGISFISNPYVLGPYVSGIFEFNIPYEELPGLKESYAYEKTYIRKLFPGVSVKHDINGDGAADEICYSILSDENFENAMPSLIINEKDFSSEFNNLHLSYLYTGAYYLIDINPDDTYIELAISSEDTESFEKSCTHFFRYDSSNQLVYLGNLDGIFSEDMQVSYNSNGNLILFDRKGDIIRK